VVEALSRLGMDAGQIAAETGLDEDGIAALRQLVDDGPVDDAFPRRDPFGRVEELLDAADVPEPRANSILAGASRFRRGLV
jgi:hypothetical protein